jgi:hypothetical protein
MGQGVDARHDGRTCRADRAGSSRAPPGCRGTWGDISTAVSVECRMLRVQGRAALHDGIRRLQLPRKHAAMASLLCTLPAHACTLVCVCAPHCTSPGKALTECLCTRRGSL